MQKLDGRSNINAQRLGHSFAFDLMSNLHIYVSSNRYVSMNEFQLSCLLSVYSDLGKLKYIFTHKRNQFVIIAMSLMKFQSLHVNSYDFILVTI